MKTEGLRPRHVVVVRHGESEGDVRRAAKDYRLNSDKHPLEEEQTKLGHEQSRAAGSWIARFILRTYAIDGFDTYLSSPLIRTKQSADSLGLVAAWHDEPRLSERDRGNIQGLTKREHRQLFPESYQQMREYPFHWTPPGGESLLRVSTRLAELATEIDENFDTALLMTHRDIMWATHISIDGMDVKKVEQLDTDIFGNSRIFHYTNISPQDGGLDEQLRWKRSVDPCNQSIDINGTLDWVDLRANQK